MRSYRSLLAWQRAHELCIETLRLTDEYNRPPTFALFDQLRRAAISVEANIVEGFALQTPKQFRRHLRIAIGSAAEVECLLSIAIEMMYFPAERTTELVNLVGETLALIFGLVRSLKIQD